MSAQPAPKQKNTERLLIAILAATLLLALPVFLYRVINDAGGTDFPEFHAAGRHVLEHGARHPESILHRYLPSVDVAWTLLGWMPRTAAAVVYYLFTVFTWLGLLRAIGHYLLPTTPITDRRIVLAAAGLLAIVFTIDHLFLGAFHILMLWLMIAGVGRVMHNRNMSGAMLLGVAVWLKLLPLLAVCYLLLKRKWGPALISLAVAFMLDAGLSLAAYGPREAWSAHVAWWHTRAVGDLETILTADEFTAQQRDQNQASAAVMRRLLRRTPDVPADARVPRVSLANLSGSQLKVAYLCVIGSLAAALAWFWRRPARGLPASRWAAEVALVPLATLWFSPIVFGYHPTAALPALAIVLGTRWEQSRLKQLTLVVWIAGVVLLAIPAARAVGECLWASILLGATVALTASPQPVAAGPRTGR